VPVHADALVTADGQGDAMTSANEKEDK